MIIITTKDQRAFTTSMIKFSSSNALVFKAHQQREKESVIWEETGDMKVTLFPHEIDYIDEQL